MVPENLKSLHLEEERIRDGSLAAIAQDPAMRDHLEMIFDAMDLVDVLRKEPHRSDDHLTVMYVGLRLFNDACAMLKLGLSGYYQAAWAAGRDILEVFDLIDFFLTSPEQISVWRTADSRERYKRFKPSVIRKKLNDRDGLKDNKRGAVYAAFSEHASHPTFAGVDMLRPGRNGAARSGPFVDARLLAGVIGDLARYLTDAVLVFAKHFKEPSNDGRVAKQFYYDKLGTWRSKYFKKPGNNVGAAD